MTEHIDDLTYCMEHVCVILVSDWLQQSGDMAQSGGQELSRLWRLQEEEVNQR